MMIILIMMHGDDDGDDFFYSSAYVSLEYHHSFRSRFVISFGLTLEWIELKIGMDWIGLEPHLVCRWKQYTIHSYDSTCTDTKPSI